jgi:hypothetical protein
MVSSINSEIKKNFSRLTYEKFLISISIRSKLLFALSLYSALWDFQKSLFNIESFVMQILIGSILFFNVSLKDFFERRNKNFYIVLYSILESSIVSYYILRYTGYTNSFYSPFLFYYFISSVIPLLYNSKVVAITVLFYNLIATTLMYFCTTDVDLFAIFFNSSKITFYFNYVVYFLFACLFAFTISHTLNSLELIQKFVFNSSYKTIFSESIESISFHNRTEDFENLKVSSEVIQSEYLGGGDFICAERKGDFLYCLIGDISSHGANVIPGAYLASIIFKNVISFHPKNELPTFYILNRINEVLFTLEENSGGNGLAICLRINLKNSQVFYSGFIYSNCITLNDKALSVSQPVSLGVKNTFPIDEEFKITLKNKDVITITTDGWTSVDDDRAKLVIEHV